MRWEPSPIRSRTRGQRTATGPMPVMICARADIRGLPAAGSHHHSACRNGRSERLLPLPRKRAPTEGMGPGSGQFAESALNTLYGGGAFAHRAAVKREDANLGCRVVLTIPERADTTPDGRVAGPADHRGLSLGLNAGLLGARQRPCPRTVFPSRVWAFGRSRHDLHGKILRGASDWHCTSRVSGSGYLPRRWKIAPHNPTTFRAAPRSCTDV